MKAESEEWNDVSPWLLLPAMVIGALVFAFLAERANRYPVRKANGQVIQVPSDNIPWHRKGWERQYAHDEITEGEFHGVNSFNRP